MDDLWLEGTGHDVFDDMTTSLSPVSHDKLDIDFVGFLPLVKQSHLGIDTSEDDIHLLMNFMEDSFARQYSLHQPPSITQKSWLLRLMLRSPTFYNTSLSMSAYHLHLSEAYDSHARETTLKKYQRYREMALRSFDKLESSLSSSHGEMVICGVHIARLEALGKNMASCQSHLQRVAQAISEKGCLLQGSLACDSGLQRKPHGQFTSSDSLPFCPDPMSSMPTSRPPRQSPMELQAEVLFAATFVWNDILCSAAEKRMSRTASIHRKLLADDGFASAFTDTTGCETWVMTAIMDITCLEIKKEEQVAQGNLSIRGLVSQANIIEETVDREMARLSSTDSPSRSPDDPGDMAVPHGIIQTLIFGHAVLVFLNTVVSGALAGVPEIHQSINRAMQAWEMLPATMNTKYLAWAYSTSASLATGSQRDFFRHVVVARMSRLDVDAGSFLRELVATTEQIDMGFLQSDDPFSPYRILRGTQNSEIIIASLASQPFFPSIEAPTKARWEPKRT
ncbi:hypothetical protein ED733_005883 [Metarhizium rileyi]|uniref:PRO1A C6 Zink-finger protein n=1 Tax=Metarhizium rileyi (strain RCEF 4871) TaxID=1649241 RepID=A0A5C6GJA2_METRR|nr:hypothetical protein ED733_005883 [Metarhizium rileyi]